jgi:hypothetical protein
MSWSCAKAGIAKAVAAVRARKVLRIMWCHSRYDRNAVIGEA